MNSSRSSGRSQRGEAVAVGHLGDRRGDVRRHLAHAVERRVEAALREVGLAGVLGERARGGHEHLVRDARRAHRDHAEAHAREDVRVVALARHVVLAAEVHRVERAARREQRLAARPLVRLRGRALRLRGRVRQREHDRPLVEAGHLLDDFPREHAGRRAHADDRGGLERLARRRGSPRTGSCSCA